MFVLFFIFFFSSRRRHTRYWRDWSSDVWSSDLGGTGLLAGIALDRDALAAEPRLPAKAYASIRSHGVILRPLGEALAVSPPLTISSSEIQLIDRKSTRLNSSHANISYAVFCLKK